jgi:hypothetical protein
MLGSMRPNHLARRVPPLSFYVRLGQHERAATGLASCDGRAACCVGQLQVAANGESARP